MSELPSALRDQLQTVEIHENDIARLADIYQRSVARILLKALVSGGFLPQTDPVQPVRRLTPGLVHRAYGLGAKCLSTDEAPTLLAGLRRASAPPAPTRVLRETSVWAREGAVSATAALAATDHGEVAVVENPSSAVIDSLRAARAALAESWEAAWQEHNTLIDCVVFAQGTLRSATNQNTFGAIYVSVEEAEDPLRLFEVLLHETGHHSLALREQFTSFLTNADALSTHPLRPDPRPLRGTLHAAFVLARITQGLGRYLDTHPLTGPLDRAQVTERLEANRTMLASVLRGLQDNAQWTDDGQALHRTLHAALDRQEVAA